MDSTAKAASDEAELARLVSRSSTLSGTETTRVRDLMKRIKLEDDRRSTGTVVPDDARPPTPPPSKKADDIIGEYHFLTDRVLEAGLVHSDEVAMAEAFEAKHGLGEKEREAALARRGWTLGEWRRAAEYCNLLKMVLADGVINSSEMDLLRQYESERGISQKERDRALKAFGWRDEDTAPTKIVPEPARPLSIKNVTDEALRKVSESFAIRIARSHIVRLDFGDLSLATGKFAEEARLGKAGGSFGMGVYRATLPKLGSPVAIKRLDHRQEQGGEREFVAELDTLAEMRDPHLVHLLGYAHSGDERCLVYELMGFGSLEERLSAPAASDKSLGWHHRLRVALQISQALYYLHTHANHETGCAFVHGDVKSTSILFDERGTAKLANFGMARRIKINADNNRKNSMTSMTLQPGGGVSPGYSRSTEEVVITPGSDVYSFGVILLELLTAMPAFDAKRQPPTLADFVLNKALKDVLDPVLFKEAAGVPDSAPRLLEIALGCLKDSQLEDVFDQLIELEIAEIEEQQEKSVEHHHKKKHHPPSIIVVHQVQQQQQQQQQEKKKLAPWPSPPVPASDEQQPLLPSLLPALPLPARPLRIVTVTFNCGERPLEPLELLPMLNHGTLRSKKSQHVLIADFVVIALQEVPIGSVFARVGEMFTAHLEQHELLSAACVSHIRMKMRLLVFRRRDTPATERLLVTEVAKSMLVKGGVAKGACLASLTCGLGDGPTKRLTFVAVHLPAHEGKLKMRNAALKAIMQKFRPLLRQDHTDASFILGDLNFRLDFQYDLSLFPEQPGASASASTIEAAMRERVHQLAADGDYASLLKLDELTRQPGAAWVNDAGLGGFLTPEIKFKPTFKVWPGSSEFLYQRKRIPAYTDRVLFRANGETNLECVEHDAVPDVTTSDHKPIRAAFEITDRDPADDPSLQRFLARTLSTSSFSSSSSSLGSPQATSR